MAHEFAGAYDAAVLDANSQLLKLVSFELVTEPGGVLATLYTDRLRTLPVVQPFLSDAEGNVHLFTDPGRYRLRQVGVPPGEELTVQPDPDETEGELEAHVIAADPHPVYLTAAEGAAAFDGIGTAAAGDASHVAAGDPHPVYLTQAEGDSAYAPVSEPSSAVHVADPIDAHDASAVSFVPTGTVAATDVQAAIAEVAAQAAIGEFFNVKRDFGAVGDGVADDTIPIQSAIGAASAAGGGIVFFPPGTYRVTSTLTIPIPGGVTLRGSGMFTCGVRANIAAPVLQSSNPALHSSNNWFEDIYFVNGSLPGSVGIDMTRMSDGGAKRVVLRFATDGLLLSGDAYYNEFFGLEVLDCTVGVRCQAGANENHFWGGRAANCTTGLILDDVSNPVVMAMAIENFTVGIDIAPTGGVSSAKVMGSRLESAGGIGIRVNPFALAAVLIGNYPQGLTTNILDLAADTEIVAPYDGSGWKANRMMVRGKLQTDTPVAVEAGLNLPHGIAPAAPIDGDMWTTAFGMFVRINGVTVGPLS